MSKNSRVRWFGHERKDDNDWVKRCATWQVEDDSMLKKDLVGLR